MSQQAQGARGGNAAARFGTFAGVFTPNVLTILGIILFLRLGRVTGEAGLWGALTIVFLANAISLLTGLSLSSIATNMRVGAGGNYYIISRSLGLEIGGAIGIPLYLSQAISVAFYIIGFTEAFMTLEIFAQLDATIISLIVAFVFITISYIGADFALKIQFFILAILIGALISFFIGGFSTAHPPITTPDYAANSGFWIMFALFFPAVTGIEVGTSMSGDLKDPSKSIPLGTILSIVVTATVYMAATFWLATSATREQLLTDNLVMQQIAIVPELIIAGVWASTLSSALGSVLAAPRTLQAVANDRVLPHWMASQLGSKTEPRMAVLITGVIAIAVILMGNLDFVAPVISMFFLNTYGMVNVAATVEKVVGNPSYRPRFRVPWFLSLLGIFGCYGAMFLINPLATFVAIIISYGVYFYLQRKQIQRTWGDVRSGIWIALARYALFNLEQERWHVKNWRPNIIVFTGQPHHREQLVEVSNWLSHGQGIVTFFQLIVGDIGTHAEGALRDTARKHIRTYIEQHSMNAFAEAEIVHDFKEGALIIAQAHGLGGIEANTILMGWSNTESGRASQLDLMRHLVALHKSVLFLNYNFERKFGNFERINVWWQGRGGNADLMLLLVYIITQHRNWKDVKVSLIRIVPNHEAVDSTRDHMKDLLRTVRVNAEPVILIRSQKDKPLAETIREYSLNADLTLLGMHLPDEKDIATYSERLNALVSSVGSVLLVRNAQLEEDLLEAE